MSNNYQQVSFLKGAHNLKQLPPDEGVEVAFAGRSNAGKSSALNRLTGSKSLARTSKTPGRTQLINLFELTPEFRLVDLPGYGFAKVSHKMKETWQKTLGDYLQTRDCLNALVLLMDIRHPGKDMDWAMIEWALKADLELMVLLSKSDKVKNNQKSLTLKQIKAELKNLAMPHNYYEVTAFSSLKGEGVTILQNFLDRQFKKKPDLGDEIG